jgi:hypothetical protein
MALWEETLMKERIAKVCKSTPKFPYQQFTIVDSIMAACLERVQNPKTKSFVEKNNAVATRNGTRTNPIRGLSANP